MHFHIEDLKKHGFLRYGFSNYYATAEAFIRQVAVEACPEMYSEYAVMMSLAGKDVELNERSFAQMHYSAKDSIFNFTVFHGNFFEAFLSVCAKTRLLDPWFMSNEFMSNVWAGEIHGNWSIMCHHENGDKEPYRNRFRKFVSSLDERGLKWTEKYLAPDKFWGQKKAYWSEQ